MNSILRLIGLVALIGTASSTLAAPLSNGSFETSTVAGPYAYLPGGSFALTPWEARQNGVEWFNPDLLGYGWGKAENGDYAVDLAPTNTAGGAIRQHFDTAADQWYKVNFYGSTVNDAGRDGTGQVEAYINGNLIQTFYLSNNTATLDWQPLSFYFKTAAGTTSTTVNFQNHEDPNLHFAFIDDVSVAATPPPVDLVIDSLTATPSPAAVGQTVNLVATVRNAGLATADNFDVDLYNDHGNTVPAAIETGDKTCNVTSLAPGATTTCTSTAIYTSTGTVIAWARVDRQDKVVETNESNNVNHVSVAVRLPDLRVTSLSAPTSNVTVGESVTITATVANVGAADALNFVVDLYKNRSSAPTVGSPGFWNCAVSILHPNESTTCTQTTSYAATGTYQVWAQADTQNSETETNEDNNLGGPATVTVALPDLYITSLRSTYARKGRPVTLITTVYNTRDYAVGDTFTIDIYKSSTSAPDAGLAGEVSCTVNGLGVGGGVSCSGKVTYLNAGTYNIWSRVDRGNAVMESNEANNLFGPVTVNVR